MNNTLIIYHGNCIDGFCAAWIASRALQSNNIYPASYGNLPPLELAEGKDVYILDFSYSRAQMEQLLAVSKSLTVIDHHKTAQENLLGFPNCIFDMNHSGAMLTWKFFHPNEEAPWLVRYVEDGDLWKFELPDSKDVCNLLRMEYQDLEEWDCLVKCNLSDIIFEARASETFITFYTYAQIKNARRISIDGISAAIVNTPYEFCSNTLNLLLERWPNINIAMGWYITSEGLIKASLRSRPDIDCSKIALKFGGGGHKNAAGFVISASESINFVSSLVSASSLNSESISPN